MDHICKGMPVWQALLLLAFLVLVEKSTSSPYKTRFYKYDVQQEDCEYEEDYPRPEQKIIETKPDLQYDNQGEDCDEDKGSVSSNEGDYPQQELQYDSPEIQKPTKKFDMDIPPASHNNVIPQSSNLPVYPQWGAHEPNPEKDFHGTKKINEDGSSEYPGITNVQAVDAQPPRSPYPGFSRRCDSYFDCDFATPYSNSSHEMDASTWFACDGRFCMCELLGVARDDVPLRVSWSKEMRKCLSDEGGPCGRHNGLTIYCDMQFVCRDNYCEKPGRVKPKPGCDNNGDCEDDRQTSLFSILFFPSNTFHNILNNSLTGIVEEDS